MQSQTAADKVYRTRWSSILSKTAAAILLFELLSGIAITFGPFHPAVEWSALLHTMVGVLTLAPLVWYLTAQRQWDGAPDPRRAYAALDSYLRRLR